VEIWKKRCSIYECRQK